ncbi:ribosomal protein S18 acetylase RimI-like enzyme [Methylorubrum rhodinum]|uniref:Ribosomal protein S18 acetylase RimI-like enzyme n=1 Tax=Methylorubrum rhodinum TaxID=29428 RepID=A0A840ZES3_9HYPH|nr:GNAT family N-acetyltransferase [Methylorubrum rhodinum]MBB5756432.1 ribosomal protein S18 acetylase RimI-like enzyme [Methylorubrum rhodinum]
MHRRPEGEEDAPFLFALHAADHGATFSMLPPPLRDLLLRQTFDGKRLTYRVRYPDARWEILEADGAPIGRIVTDRGARGLTLIDIALLPERRGRGLGARLIAETMDEARAAGLPLHLTVAADNPGARRLYERLGFVPGQATELHTELVWTPPAAPGA